MNADGRKSAGFELSSYFLDTILAVHRIAVAASYRDQFFTDKMETDFGTGLLFDVTDHCIANHFVEFFERVGHGENRLAQGFRGVAPLRRIAHDEDDFVHVRPPKQETAGWPAFRPAGKLKRAPPTRPAILRRSLRGGRRRIASASPRRSPGWHREAPRSASLPPHPRPRSSPGGNTPCRCRPGPGGP